jgi:hypothetical protein
MSTKMTIHHGEGFHLYAECLESSHVYLEIDGAEWVESHGSEFWREELAKKDLAVPPPEMVLRIPTKIAEALFDSDLTVIEEGMPARDITKGTPFDEVSAEALKEDIRCLIRILRSIGGKNFKEVKNVFYFDRALTSFTLTELTK